MQSIAVSRQANHRCRDDGCRQMTDRGIAPSDDISVRRIRRNGPCAHQNGTLALAVKVQISKLLPMPPYSVPAATDAPEANLAPRPVFRRRRGAQILPGLEQQRGMRGVFAEARGQSCSGGTSTDDDRVVFAFNHVAPLSLRAFVRGRKRRNRESADQP